MPDSPSLQAIILADFMIMDANRRKWSAVGIFSHVLGQTFPLIHPQFDVLAVVADPPAEGTVVISIVSPSGVVINSGNQHYQVKDRTQTIECGLHFSAVPFRAPGRYAVQVHVNEELVGQCTLWAKQIGGGA